MIQYAVMTVMASHFNMDGIGCLCLIKFQACQG